jgi:hypothetical protein
MVFSSLVVLLTLIFSSQGFQPLDFHDGIYKPGMTLPNMVIKTHQAITALWTVLQLSGYQPQAIDYT